MNQFIEKKHAFLFQGVGGEYQRFLHLLDEEQKEILNNYCSIVNKELELDLWNYLYNSSITKYDKLFNDWVAIYTCDCIIYSEYINFNIKPEIFVGYSMGLITSMVCGKSISFETGLHMLLNIYEYPQYALRQEETMGVIIGMNFNEVEKIIRENTLEQLVEIASENSEHCIVISGIKSSVIKIMEIAKEEGAIKVKELNVPYAFHSHNALNGIERYINFVENIKVVDCMTPIISIFNQDLLQSANDLKKELIRNMSSRMYWKTSIEKITYMGINSFVEVGLGDSLTKMSKLINIDNKFFTHKRFIKAKLESRIMEDQKSV